MKKLMAFALVLVAAACSNPTAPDPNARHLGTTLTPSICADGSFRLQATWADADYTAEFFANSKLVDTQTGNTGRVKTSACVYHKNDAAFVRFTPLGDITKYLDVTTSKTITIQ